MPARVCHITSVHPANDVRILYKECHSLAQHYDTYLLAPNVNDSLSEGVHIVGVPLSTHRLQRQLQLGRVMRKALEVDADIYHLHDPELMSVGLRIRRQGKRVIFDSHEDVPMQLLTKEYLPRWSRKPLSSLYAQWERHCLSRYDALITVTPSILERLRRINPNSVMVTNYPRYQVLPHSYGRGGQQYVCFAGEIAERYMHHVVLESLRLTTANYLLAGRVFVDAYFQQLQRSDLWSRVEYLGVLPPYEVGSLYQRADVGLVLLDYSPNVGYHKGTLGVLKMFEYMMAGLPVVATDFELWKEVVEGHQCGICVNPHDPQAVAAAVNHILSHPDIAQQMGNNGRKAVETLYNWATQEPVLLGLYEQVLGNLLPTPDNSPYSTLN